MELITIPKHGKEVKLYCVKDVMRVLNLTANQFLKELDKF
jgi:hypothetical protein